MTPRPRTTVSTRQLRTIARDLSDAVIDEEHKVDSFNHRVEDLSGSMDRLARVTASYKRRFAELLAA